MKKLLLFMIGTMLAFSAYGQINLPPCPKIEYAIWKMNCRIVRSMVKGITPPSMSRQVRQEDQTRSFVVHAERKLLSLPIESIGAIEVMNMGTMHRFERDQAGVWFYHGMHDASKAEHSHQADPKAADLIDKTLTAFGRTRRERSFPLNAATDKFGVTRPDLFIIVYQTGSAEPLARFAVGTVTADSFGRYVLPVGRAEVVRIAEFQIKSLLDLIKVVNRSTDLYFGGSKDDKIRTSMEPPPLPVVASTLDEERGRLEADRQALAERERRFDEKKRNREQVKQSSKLAIQASATAPDANGFVVITIQTNADTSSLKINGEEQGGKPDGNYSVRKVARVGQETKYIIVALDSNGNTDTKTVAVTRQAASTDITYAALNPVNIKQQPNRDAVAIIIGIQNYKRVAKAPYANDDARAFYDYAIRALGIKPENIKLLVDEEADEIEIIQAFENWLPVHVNKNRTEVYVFYAGHGLPSTDGKSLYFLPYGVDKQYLARTAVGQKEVVAALAASKPKTVTMFIDACYSGSTRSGEILVADARPVNLKMEQGIYPPNFTVISASANDQISSSSPELKHGIFSFYLMKGMEGDADGNKDGKITVGEMQEYLSDKVSRQAMTKNAQQDTQLVGDATRVLVTR